MLQWKLGQEIFVMLVIYTANVFLLQLISFGVYGNMLKKYSIQLDKGNQLQYLIGLLCLVVYVGTLFFPLMDKDAAHHANIALHMYEHHDYLSLVDRGNDYLDKPHFLFWVSLLSFKIFGINTFAHRFPAILFALVSIASVYKLSRHLYGSTTARMAALILATAQAFMLSIVDARMETPLAAAIIFGMWQLIVYVDNRSFLNLLLAALGTAIAFSTKGWLGPVIILSSVFFYILFNRKWTVLASLKTWLFIPLFLLFITPVLYAYYYQYDLHPEKLIRGQNNISGVRFILWDQLFERYKGFDEGGRNSSYFFLYHTFLWAFFPWSIIAYGGLVFWLNRIFRHKKWNYAGNFAAASFGFLLFAISFSKFKMPHYIIMLLPLASLFTAPYLRFILTYKKGLRFFYPLQFGFAILILLVTIALNYYFFQPLNLVLLFVGTMLLLLFILLLVRKMDNRALKIFYITAATSVVFNFFMNYNFFPSLLHFQAGNEMARRMDQERIMVADSQIMLIDPNAHSFDFYRQYNHPVVDVKNFSVQFPNIQDKYFLLSNYYRNYLRDQGFEVRPVISQPDYNVATIKMSFLNPVTRNQKMDTLMLAKIVRR